MKTSPLYAQDVSFLRDTTAVIYPITELQSMYSGDVDFHQEQYDKIKQSIEENGMEHPIIVLRTNYRGWRILAGGTPELNQPPKGADPAGVVHLVMCGNNRVRAAIELGYQSIEGVSCQTTEEVNKLCKLQRNDWRKKS